MLLATSREIHFNIERPAWDPDFNTADLFVFLELARMENRYARHYLRRAS